MSACPTRSRVSWSSRVPTAALARRGGPTPLYDRTSVSSGYASHPGLVTVSGVCDAAD
ncbi:hypothetical protein [Streptomyces sp. NBC_01803]|uniref:hypothetical protein n=1 Tax=Streptomyces sp. NBC_01803 TaxID=2975946 RepID=UPI002DDBB3B1|nr:hypothetical protein [Streptomyces sp. NBC_01803]WSA47794.1 hypothetical protein OIE51_05220 [Streptomyces sp. NBC_01803]